MADYAYLDLFRADIFRMIPEDGKIIGTIGCGTARTEARLVEQGREVHGVDVAAGPIEVAKGRLTSARVIEPNNVAPFEPASLDGLILADVLEHLPDAWRALESFTQAVKPGGWVVISVPNMRYVGALRTFLIGGDWPEASLGIFDQTHIQVMTHKRLERWCRNAGLRPEKEFDIYDFGFLRRNIYRALNLASFRMLKSFLNFAIQARYRKAKY